MNGQMTDSDFDDAIHAPPGPRSGDAERKRRHADITANLGWDEAIAHHRLVALATAHHAHRGLKEIARGEGAPDVPWYLQGHMEWLPGLEGDAVGAWTLRATGENHPVLEDGPGWAWATKPETVRERVMSQQVDGVEQRRASWSAWDPDEPRPAADQARIILAPVWNETSQQRAVTVDVRAGLHLDGTLRADTAKIVWTGPKECGEYPARSLFTEAETPQDIETIRKLREVQEEMTAAARWLTALYRLGDMRPIRRA